jgi:hypothetical protein
MQKSSFGLLCKGGDFYSAKVKIQENINKGRGIMEFLHTALDGNGITDAISGKGKFEITERAEAKYSKSLGEKGGRERIAMSEVTWLSVKEFAKRVSGMSEYEARRLAAEGILPCRAIGKSGRNLRISLEAALVALDDYAREQTEERRQQALMKAQYKERGHTVNVGPLPAAMDDLTRRLTSFSRRGKKTDKQRARDEAERTGEA